jgi:hypothetical protein
VKLVVFCERDSIVVQREKPGISFGLGKMLTANPPVDVSTFVQTT